MINVLVFPSLSANVSIRGGCFVIIEQMIVIDGSEAAVQHIQTIESTHETHQMTYKDVNITSTLLVETQNVNIQNYSRSDTCSLFVTGSNNLA